MPGPTDRPALDPRGPARTTPARLLRLTSLLLRLTSLLLRLTSLLLRPRLLRLTSLLLRRASRLLRLTSLLLRSTPRRLRLTPLPLALVLLLAACGPAPVTPSAADIDDPAGTLARLASEPEGPGRKPLILALRRAPTARVMPVLESGLASPDPALRSAAAIATARRDDGATLAPTLISLATTDPDPRVRIAATRGLAILRHAAAFPALLPNLSHETATIRLSALRALARIDPTRTAALPDLARLQLDPDARVADAATKIARGLDPQ